MSRSYKKQSFAAICGGGSAKQDKIIAHRSVRRTVNRILRKALREDDFDIVIPHFRECAYNNVYGWGRDGNQRWCGLDSRDYGKWIEANFRPESWWYGDEDYICWPPFWYKDMMRK